MNIFLIDFENVKSDGLSGLELLLKEDRVYIFYSEKADTISIGLHSQILKSESYFEFIKVGVGIPNALDFQLSSFLGYLIGTSEENSELAGAKYCIISNDTGFKTIIEFWKRTKSEIQISLTPSIKEFLSAPAKQAGTKQSSKKLSGIKASPSAQKIKTPVTKDDIFKMVPEAADEEWAEDIVTYLEVSESKDDLYKKIKSRLGQDKGTIIYNKLKKLL